MSPLLQTQGQYLWLHSADMKTADVLENSKDSLLKCDSQTDRLIYKQMTRQTDRWTDRDEVTDTQHQMDKQADRWTNKREVIHMQAIKVDLVFKDDSWKLPLVRRKSAEIPCDIYPSSCLSIQKVQPSTFLPNTRREGVLTHKTPKYE